jgi:hypothetical protein
MRGVGVRLCVCRSCGKEIDVLEEEQVRGQKRGIYMLCG